jgi:hypothetical protein
MIGPDASVEIYSLADVHHISTLVIDEIDTLGCRYI